MTSEADRQAFEQQLGGMSTQEIVGKIKSKGYWSVVMRPTIFNKQRIATPSIAQEIQ